MLREAAGLVLRVDLATVDLHVEDAAVALDELHFNAGTGAQTFLDGGRQTGGLREIISAHAVLDGDVHRIPLADGLTESCGGGRL